MHWTWAWLIAGVEWGTHSFLRSPRRPSPSARDSYDTTRTAHTSTSATHLPARTHACTQWIYVFRNVIRDRIDINKHKRLHMYVTKRWNRYNLNIVYYKAVPNSGFLEFDVNALDFTHNAHNTKIFPLQVDHTGTLLSKRLIYKSLLYLNNI